MNHPGFFPSKYLSFKLLNPTTHVRRTREEDRLQVVVGELVFDRLNKRGANLIVVSESHGDSADLPIPLTGTLWSTRLTPEEKQAFDNH